jgi:hypothetical protein
MQGFQKALPGWPDQMPAKIYNLLVDLAAGQDFQGTGTGAQPFGQTGIVLVKNTSGADVTRFQVLGLDAPLISSSADLDEFQRQVAFQGAATVFANHFGKFAVMLEPVANGDFGRGVVSGVVPTLLNIDKGLWPYADILEGSVKLECQPTGAATVLWTAASSGDQWAIVRLGSSPDGVCPVQITSITPTSGRFPGTVYDRDLGVSATIWVVDDNGDVPQLGVFYDGRRAANVSGVWVFRVESMTGGPCHAFFDGCDGDNNPVYIYGRFPRGTTFNSTPC